MLVTRGTPVTNIPWQGTSCDITGPLPMADCSQVGMKFNPNNTESNVQSPEQSSCWLMIEIFRLARLPHAQVRACCARLVVGGWWVVSGNQCSDSRPVHPCVQLSRCPAPAAKHYFSIRNHNAEWWICRPFPGVRVAATAARRGLTPQHLVRGRYSSNIHQHQTVNILC